SAAQPRRQIGGRSRPVARVALERIHDGRVERGRNVRGERRWRRDLALADELQEIARRGEVLEERSAREQGPEQRAERVDVGARVERTTGDPLRRGQPERQLGVRLTRDGGGHEDSFNERAADPIDEERVQRERVVYELSALVLVRDVEAERYVEPDGRD